MAGQRFSSGIWLGAGAHVLWGLSPIYWNLVDGVPALEILAHRVVWSAPVLLLALAASRKLRTLPGIYRSLRSVLLALAGAVLLSVNWGLFLWSVVSERIVDASLGYFLTPLVSVVLGVVVLGERLRPAQKLAVLIAAVGVVAMTVLHGGLPWVSLALASSFGLYGLLKKTPGAAPALQGLLGEVVVVAVLGAFYIASLAGAGEGTFGTSTTSTIWLAGAGAMTVAPLWLFGEGVQRIPLSTMGLLQYLAPTLQLLVGIALYGERLTLGQLVGFVAVWLALVVFVRDQLGASRLRTTVVAADPDTVTRLPMSTDPTTDEGS